MRPNQQNNNKNRSRGRNGGRKHVNPASRNYESNGPDVKVRGNASHIAEKYVQLARDAQASGDSVMAENYLQHAEHYFRILMASQPQGTLRPEFAQDGDGDDDYDDDMNGPGDRFAMPHREDRQQQAQDAAPAEAEAPEPVRAQPEPAQSEAQAEPAKAAEAEGDAEARPRRERRPRRRTPRAAEGADLANAPQPDAPELPAFITSGTANAAE